MASHNITTSSVTINNYPSTYIPTKVSYTCRRIKYVTKFYTLKTSNDGYYNICKACRKNSDIEYYLRN